MKINCIFHNDPNPSMAIYTDHYHCFGCGAHGKITDLPPQYQKLSYRSEGRRESHWVRTGLSISSAKSADEVLLLWAQANSNVAKVMWFIKERKLFKALAFMDFGFYEDRLIIPFVDVDGKVKRIVGRAVKKNVFPKYILSGPKAFIPFVPDWYSINMSGEIYFFFGIITAISGRICNFPSMASPYGRSVSDSIFVNLVKQFPLHTFYIVPDKGEEKDAIRLYKAALDAGHGWRVSCLFPNWPEGTKDVDEVRTHYGEENVKNLLKEALHEQVYL